MCGTCRRDADRLALLFGFNPFQPDWWKWLRAFWLETGGLPSEILRPAYGGFGAFLALMVTGTIVSSGARSETIFGGRKQKDIHGTARWAETRDVKESGLLSETGVVVGGWPMRRGVRMLRHDGPEHVLAFALPAQVRASAWSFPLCFRGKSLRWCSISRVRTTL